MKLHPRLTRDTVALVTRFETFQPTAQATGEGGWSIGYGHTAAARQGAEVSRDDAHALLLYDLSRAAEAVEAALFAPVTQHQFEALCAFCFNVGADNFRRSSALARINAGAELEAADEIERWRRAELGSGAQVVDALVRRRAAEKAHFLGLPEGFSKSPSALVRPLAVEGTAVMDVTAPRDIDAETAPSAALSAANGVQARLRQLIPDAPPPASAETTVQPPAPPPIAYAVAAPDALEPGFEPPPTPDAWTAAAEPAPPPFDLPPPAEPAIPPPATEVAPLQAAVAEKPPPPEPPLSEAPTRPPVSPQPPPEVEKPPAASRAPFSRRGAYLLLTALGACLFTAAVVLIAAGRADLSNLGLGLIGAVVMTLGVYGLLGARR